MKRFFALALLVAGCWDGPKDIGPEWVDPEWTNAYHLIPFRCDFGTLPILHDSYLMIPRDQLEGVDLDYFTGSLSCEHPSYSALQCQVDD